MAITKGLLKNNTYPDGIYPKTGIDCVFDEDGNSLETLIGNHFELIWENPNPTTSSFGAQTITFNKTVESDNLLLFIWKYSGGYMWTRSQVVFPNCKLIMQMFERATIYQRDCDVTTTGMTFGECKKAAYNAASWLTDNGMQIPYRVYKIN